MDLYNKPTWPNRIKLDIKQKFIHEASIWKLSKHYNNKGLLV